MKEIGGYFELELCANGIAFHDDAVKLNSGRSCLEYIIKSQNVKKVYIPNYICNAIVEPLITSHIAFEFYNINLNFELLDLPELRENEKVLYVDYFGLKQKYIYHVLFKEFGSSLILDYTHSFFTKPIDKIDTFYSPRKFFGVADGGFLYTQIIQDELLMSKATSYQRMKQLLGRVDIDAKSFYQNFIESEKSISDEGLKAMSNLTFSILSSIDFNSYSKKRIENFSYLHSYFETFNVLSDLINDAGGDFIPIYYPLLLNIEVNEIKKSLIENNIFIPTLWSEVLFRDTLNHDEFSLVNNMILLPVDQRYSISDMKSIVEKLNFILERKK